MPEGLRRRSRSAEPEVEPVHREVGPPRVAGRSKRQTCHRHNDRLPSVRPSLQDVFIERGATALVPFSLKPPSPYGPSAAGFGLEGIARESRGDRAIHRDFPRSIPFRVRRAQRSGSHRPTASWTTQDRPRRGSITHAPATACSKRPETVAGARPRRRSGRATRGRSRPSSASTPPRTHRCTELSVDVVGCDRGEDLGRTAHP